MCGFADKGDSLVVMSHKVLLPELQRPIIVISVVTHGDELETSLGSSDRFPYQRQVALREGLFQQWVNFVMLGIGDGLERQLASCRKDAIAIGEESSISVELSRRIEAFLHEMLERTDRDDRVVSLLRSVVAPVLLKDFDFGVLVLANPAGLRGAKRQSDCMLHSGVIDQPPEHRSPAAADVQNAGLAGGAGRFNVMVQFPVLGGYKVFIGLEHPAGVVQLRIEDEPEEVLAHVVMGDDRIGRCARPLQ